MTKEYQYVLKVWNKFEIKTMKNYLNLYLKCNVLLLADTKRCLENYGLCPTHYLSSLALSRDAMLSMTKVKLDLTSDVAMYLFFENELKCGVCYIFNFKRYIKANNKYLTSHDL